MIPIAYHPAMSRIRRDLSGQPLLILRKLLIGVGHLLPKHTNDCIGRPQCLASNEQATLSKNLRYIGHRIILRIVPRDLGSDRASANNIR
jgi:hypothetical protein